MKLCATSFLCLAILSCGRPSADNNKILNPNNYSNIINGETVRSNSALSSHIALISTVDESGNTEICTGAFIARNKVLTAKHCIAADLNDMSVTSRSSNYDSDLNVVDHPILQVQIISKVNISGRQDLALIEVETSFDSHIVPIQISRSQILTSELILVGFGVTSADTSSGGELRTKTVSFKSDQMTRTTFEVDQNKNQGGVCFGDSGGPASYFDQKLNEYVLVGIASAVISTENTEACMNKSIFMNVLFYHREIEGLL